MSENKYAIYSEKQAPRLKKTQLLAGSGEDTTKYYRCWYCGFICDSKRDVAIGGKAGTNSVIPTSFTDDDGGTLYYPKVTKGCPFCGSTNYR